MLAIRMRRTGRKGHAQFRVIVQDSKFSPSSGRVVSYLGSYDPHAKKAALDKEKIDTYLKNGAHPSDRVARLLKAEGINLPGWVKETSPKTRSIRHPEKLRRNRPAEESQPEAEAETEQATENADEAPAAESGQTESPKPAAEPEAAPAESAADETPAAEETTVAAQDDTPDEADKPAEE